MTQEQLNSPLTQEPDASDIQATPKEKQSPKWESDARNQIKLGIKALKKPLQDLIDRDAVEADTRLFITDFMEKVFGYDKYTNLTAEYQVKGDWADYGVRIDGDLVAFIEAKRVNQTLNDKHLKQVQTYAVNEGVDWLILTNGRVWQVYHLKAEGLPIQTDLVLSVDLLASSPKEIESELFYLHIASMKRKAIIDLWKRREAVSDVNVIKALTSESVVTALKSQLIKQTGYRVTSEEVKAALIQILEAK